MIGSYKDQLQGKILVDISNPVNETYDDLATPPGTSAAEELAKIAPGARVVKAFNTTFAGLLAQGHVGASRSTCLSPATMPRPKRRSPG